MFSRPTVIYTDPEADRSHSVIKHIAHRVLKNNKNFLCAVTGQTGSGKSWASGSIAEIYSKRYGIHYDPEKHTFFSLKELLELINNKKENDIKTGSILVFDESQIDVNARAWQSEANRIMSSLISTFRNQRLVVLFPTPYLEFLDRQTRILFHAKFEMLGYDKTTNTSKIKPLFLTDFNPRRDEFYRKRLLVRFRERGKDVMSKYHIREWEIPKPSKEWIEIYENKKQRFTDELNRALLIRSNKEGRTKEELKEEKAKRNKQIIQAYHDYGENYVKLSQMFPDLSLPSLKEYIYLIKKSYTLESAGIPA